MNVRKFVWILLVCWLLIYLWSFASLFLTEATGDSFTRGLNRVTAFFGWQILAGALAITIWWMGHHFEGMRLARWACRLPAILAGLLVLACVGIIVAANFQHPAPESELSPTPSTKPITAPAIKVPDEPPTPAPAE